MSRKPMLEQILQRRRQLRLTQQDMQSRIGMTRQQYQRLEREGNPRLDTLSLVAEGLNSDLMLIPREKRLVVQQLLNETGRHTHPPADENPWHGLLDEES